MSEPDEKSHRLVLVVEGKQELRELLCGSLEGAGFKPRPCEDALEAARLLTHTAPALLVIDLELPLAQSWGLLEKARLLPDPPPALALGGVDMFEKFARGVQTGVVAFAPKPVQLGSFLDTCQRAVESGEKKAPLVEPERRRERRRRLMVGVQLLDEAGKPMAIAELVDLSCGGAQLTMIARYDVGSRVRVAFDPSIAGAPIRFEGEVKWCKPASAGFSYGVKLVAVNDELERQIQAMLQPIQASGEA